MQFQLHFYRLRSWLSTLDSTTCKQQLCKQSQADESKAGIHSLDPNESKAFFFFVRCLQERTYRLLSSFYFYSLFFLSFFLFFSLFNASHPTKDTRYNFLLFFSFLFTCELQLVFKINKKKKKKKKKKMAARAAAAAAPVVFRSCFLSFFLSHFVSFRPSK